MIAKEPLGLEGSFLISDAASFSSAHMQMCEYKVDAFRTEDRGSCMYIAMKCDGDLGYISSACQSVRTVS